jgi:signal transduction histidine kinase
LVFNIYHTGMFYHGKKAMLEIFHDITDQKHSEYNLIKSKEKAEDSDRIKTAFLHNISHEIRTPMNAIVGFTALLSQPNITSENHKSYLDIITQSSDHLLSIVTDIIEISNIEAGKTKLNLSELDVNLVLENLYRRFSPIAQSKELEFKYSQLGSGKSDLILTDKTKLNQILTNLIENALKFTEEGYIRFGYSLKEGTIEFFVSDSGPGIPFELHEKIFERFFQADSSENRKYEGIGIGLSISKSYAESLGGKIWIRSEPGKGSDFYVSLPC